MARFPSLLMPLGAPLVAVATSLLTSLPRTHAEDFFFRDGDRVVMIGDSITEQHLYSNYVEMWTVTRFPHWKLTFRNVGIGGDRSPGGHARFARDVLIHEPTAMTVDFGMNDGDYREFTEETFKPYIDGLQGIADQARAAKIRVAWVTPQPLDDDQQGPSALTAYNLTLEKFSAGVTSVADRNGGLRFTRHDHALPFFPEDASSLLAADVLKAGPIADQITTLRTKFVQEQLPSIATLDAEVAARLQVKPRTVEVARLP